MNNVPLDKNILEKLLSYLPDGLIITDSAGKILFANKTACNLTGYSESELLKLNFNSLWGQFPGKSVNPKTYQFTSKSGKIYNHEILINSIDEKIFSLSLSKTNPEITQPKLLNEKTEGFNPPLVIETPGNSERIGDSPKWLLLDNALNIDSSKFWHYLSFVGSMVVVINRNGDVVYINDKGCQLIGTDKTNIVGKNWVNNFIPVNLRKEIETVLNRVFALPDDAPDSYENPILCSDGTIRIINWSNTILRDKDGSFIGALSSGEDITEIKLNERRTKESEERLKSAELKAHMGHWIRNLVTDDLFWSDGLYNVFGYKPAEYPADIQFSLMVIHEDDREEFKKAVESAVSDGIPYSLEVRGLHKDGYIIYVHIDSEIEKDENGTPISVTGIVTDISEQKKRINDLEVTTKRLLNTEEMSHTGHWEFNISTGEYLFSNEFYKIFGFNPKTESESIETLESLFHKDDRKRILKSSRDAISNGTGYSFEGRINRKDGEIRLISASADIVRDASNNPLFVRGIISDITEARLYQETITQSELRLKKAENLLMMGHWEKDLYTNKYSCSDGFFRLMGYEPGEFEADLSSLLSRVHPDDLTSTRTIINEAYKKQKGYSTEFRIIRKDNAVRYIKAESIFLKDADGNNTKSFGVVIDTTELEENQRKLAETEKTLSRAEEIASIGSWVMDIESGIYVCSNGFCKMCGLEQGNFIPTFETMNLVTHPDDRSRVNKLIEASISSGKDFNFENRIVRPDGTIRHIKSKGTYLLDKNNKPIKSIGILLDITEFKKKEDELIQNEKFLQEAEKISNMGNWVFDIATGQRHCSEGYCSVCGLDPKTFVPTFDSMTETIYIEDRKMVISMLENSRKTGKPFNFEHRILRGDGKVRYVISKGTYLFNKDNIAVKEIGTILDITDYREKEEKLIESEKRLREAELISGTGHWEWNILTDEHITSEGLLNIIGYNSLSSIQGGENINSIFSEEDRERIHRIVDNAIITGNPYSYEARIVRPDGESRFIEVRGLPIKDKNGTVIKTKGTFTDITQIKKYQEKILQNEIRFNKAEETAQIGNWERDLSTGLYTLSNGIYKILGINPLNNSATFDEQLSLVHPDDASYVIKTIESAIKNEKDYNLEHRIIRPNGEIRYVKTNATMIKNSKGQATKISGLVIDITDSKRQEQEKQAMEFRLRNQQKLESIGILAGGVAHEINNPINGIMNYSQLILDTESENDEIRNYADEIINESERISNIVKNLLQFSRQEQISYRPNDIISILNQSLSLINTIIKKDNISIITDLQESLPLVNCNSQQMQQVLMNLLTNARDALNEKHQSSSLDKVILINCKSIIKDENIVVRISIEDNGNGIPPEIQKNIFDPFFTTKGRNEGTGLGLSISFSIIEEHQGRLYFETEEDKYTRFIIELPTLAQD